MSDFIRHCQTLNIIPTPQSLHLTGGSWFMPTSWQIHVAEDLPEDVFAAGCLIEFLQNELRVAAALGSEAGSAGVQISRSKGAPQGYQLVITANGIEIAGHDAAGVYYAVQTLLQILRSCDGRLPCLEIRDAPDLAFRAVHYDTKHHQDRFDYVKNFIVELASFKANLLVWEWEDKFGYRKYPEIAAPGAFTIEQIQELTAFASQHHVELVPLVQGLGHVSYILKHPRFRNLREIPASNWELCPLREESYELLFDLWTEAIEATPGGRFLHIGSDETYELGQGRDCGCEKHAAAHGKDSLMRIFIDRCVDWVESQGRTCLSWGGEWKAGGQPPRPGMIWVDGDNPELVKASASAGYPCWIYAPNTGVTPLINFTLPWNKRTMWNDAPGIARIGGFASTYQTFSQAISDGSAEGSIVTSWDDSGLHNQMFMPHFACACEYSWNHKGVELEQWIGRFYLNYFGPQATDMRECQELLQQAALFYDDTLQRRVWHWGDVGKVHLPDFPRAGLEYDTFWRKRYAALLEATRKQLPILNRIEAILTRNRSLGARHAYDLEVMQSCLQLMQFNAEVILQLERLEELLKTASYDLHFVDRRGALDCLRQMESLLQGLIGKREEVYGSLVTCWEKSRLPKGMSAEGHHYVWSLDRARHFANRTVDMRYLMLDIDLLGLDDYLARLRPYITEYEQSL